MEGAEDDGKREEVGTRRRISITSLVSETTFHDTGVQQDFQQRPLGKGRLGSFCGAKHRQRVCLFSLSSSFLFSVYRFSHLTYDYLIPSSTTHSLLRSTVCISTMHDGSISNFERKGTISYSLPKQQNPERQPNKQQNIYCLCP